MTESPARFFHDVDDPIAFVRHALNDELRHRGGHFRETMYEDAVSYLLVVLVRLAKRYDPAKGSSFSKWAYGILRARYTDFLREAICDARYTKPPEVLSLDAAGAEQPEQTREDAVGLETLLDQIDHDKLSSRARGALRQLTALVVQEGLTIGEAAARFGKTRREASGDLDRLRCELLAAAA